MPLTVLDRGADLLRVHRTSLLARARASDVHHLGRRRETRLPARTMQPVREVDLLIVHEEGWIESSDALERRLSDCERRAGHPGNGPLRIMRIAGDVELAEPRHAAHQRPDPRIVQ